MLVSELTAGGRRKLRKNLFAVDATTISFNKDDYPWADFRETKAGIKIHVQYSIGKECPDELRIIESTDPETGKTIVILTNMKKHSAKFVSELYKKKMGCRAVLQSREAEPAYKKVLRQVRKCSLHANLHSNDCLCPVHAP